MEVFLERFRVLMSDVFGEVDVFMFAQVDVILCAWIAVFWCGRHVLCVRVSGPGMDGHRYGFAHGTGCGHGYGYGHGYGCVRVWAWK